MKIIIKFYTKITILNSKKSMNLNETDSVSTHYMNLSQNLHTFSFFPVLN